MKILVTGANGYIGSRVIKTLCDFGIKVIALDLFNNNVDSRAEFINVDIFNSQLDELNECSFDVVLHLAWRDGFIHNSTNHITDLSNHFTFLSNMVKKGVKKIVMMGSMHEIGYHVGVIDENTPCNPTTYYGIAKNTLRSVIELMCEENNVEFQWLRGFYVFDNDDKFGNSIFCKIRQASDNGETKFPFTSGKNKFDFINMKEFSRLVALTVIQDKVNGIINICSGKPVSLAEQIESYIKENNLNIELEYGKYPDKPYESECTYGDRTKIDEILSNFYNQKILVTGVKGQLGFDVCRELKERGFTNFIGIDYEDLDITNENEVKKYICECKPAIVIHNAAWTAVDKAEECVDACYAVNSLGSKYIAEACLEIGAKLMYISTDYVFDGKGECYFEVDDEKNGLSIYGKSKSQGEEYIKMVPEHWILRTSWVFGINGKNFVKTMIRLSETKKELNVVCDQIGSPTFTYDLSKLMCDMIALKDYGTYHVTNEGICSWADFAKYIFECVNADTKVNYVSTEEYRKMVPNQAARPLNSRLSKKSLDDAGYNRLPSWQDATKRFIEMLRNEVKE